MIRTVTREQLVAEHNVWPVPGLLLPDGSVRLPVQSQEYRSAADRVPHLGLDFMFRRLPDESPSPPRACGPFSVPPGVPAIASAAGDVEAIYRAPNGWRVRLDHPSGFYTLSLHLAELPALQLGQRVAVGDVLGIIGGDPSDADPAHTVHLHYEMRRISDRMPVDPTPYVDSWAILIVPVGAAPATV